MGSGASSLAPGGALSLERRIQYLRETPYSVYITPETLREFARCFHQTVRTRPGRSISLDPRKIYVVCEGEVDLSTSFPDRDAKVEAKGYLCRKRRGDVVNMCQTEKDVERRMSDKIHAHKVLQLAEELRITAVAGGGSRHVVLLCAPLSALVAFGATRPALSRPIVEICTSQIEDRLLTIPFLREVPKSKVGVLAAMCRYEAFDAGRTVFDEGEDADKLFLVLGGAAQVTARSRLASPAPSRVAPAALSERTVALRRSLECSGVQEPMEVCVTIAELRAGDYFGETGLVFDIDRTCGVKTVEKCLFLTVHKTDFENYLKICPIEEELRGVIKQRMVSKLSSLGISFLNGIPEDMLASLGSSVAINEVPQDHVIFREGDVGESFYIVVHGAVRVDASVAPGADATADGAPAEDGPPPPPKTPPAEATRRHVIGALGPGQYFGELSLVNHREHNRRTATVTATRKSILLSVDKESFQRLFGENNNVLAEFELRLLGRSAGLRHVVHHSLGVASFRDFLEAEHAGENLDFWTAARDFGRTAARGDDDDDGAATRRERAKRIFVTFCADYADRQVNLPHALLAEIDARLAGADGADAAVPPDVFDAAMDEIFRLMDKDKFPRYKQSAQFESFLGRLGVPDDLA